MTTRQRNRQRRSAIPSEPDKLFAPSEAITGGKKPASIPKTAILGSPGPVPGSSEPDPVLKSTFAPEPSSTATYIEADLQQLLQIYMDAKEALKSFKNVL